MCCTFCAVRIPAREMQRLLSALHRLKPQFHFGHHASRHLPGWVMMLRRFGVVQPLFSTLPGGFSTSQPPPAGLCLRPHLGQQLELLGDVLEDAVDVELGPPAVRLFADGAEKGLVADHLVPVAGDAGQAETVSAGRGHGVGEHVQADGAGELVLGQERCHRRHGRNLTTDEEKH